MAQEHVETPDFGSPFVYTTLEDIVLIKSTRCWRNNNVRVVGKVCCEVDDIVVLYFTSPLHSSTGPRIKLNVEPLNTDLPQGRLIEIFGYVDVSPREEPIVTVLFYRHISGVSITSYYKAIQLRNQYVPQFNDDDCETTLSPSQVSDKNEEVP